MTRTPPPEAAFEDLGLSGSWSKPERFEDTARIAGLRVHLAGFSTTSSDGRQVTGSAASITRSPVARAYFELVERTAVVDHLVTPPDSYRVLDDGGTPIATLSQDEVFPESSEPELWQYSRSNGVAAAPTFEQACTAARSELVERDRILRSWFGGPAPERLRGVRGPGRLFSEGDYSVEYYAFSDRRFSQGRHAVVGMFAFPKREAVPFVSGAGAGPNLLSATRRAVRECVQRLGFLWGEPIPTEAPGFEPTPLYHQELYLWPKMQPRLRAWLNGEHQGAELSRPPSGPPRYVDLTPEHLRSRIRVVKALPEGELPLVFGRHLPASGQRFDRYGMHPIG